jgi:N-acetylmuramic acid 6-phosphate etherase
VYDNLLVELHAGGCAKVRDRGARIISTITGIDPERALRLLDQAGGSVKQAIVMQQAGVSADAASALLERHGGRLRAAIEAPVTQP